jgi:SAM-dependent methyltransferase
MGSNSLRQNARPLELVDRSLELRDVDCSFEGARPEVALDVNGAVCPGCGATELQQFGYKSGYLLWRCITCGIVFASVRDYKMAVDELYEHYYDRARFSTSAVVVATLERLVRSCEPFRATNRWLDVGFGEGGMLEVASRLGWLSYGTEISPAAIEFGKRRAWMVTTDAKSDPRFIKQGFDVITMVELIEHLAEPMALLREAAQLLRPGGLLYITTPNANSLNRRVLGLKWSVLSPPEHVAIWSAHGLCRALTATGFKTKRLRTDGFNPVEIAARLRTHREGSQPVDRNTAAFALNSAFSSSPSRRAIKAGINRCLSSFQIGDTLKVWAVRV